jgi:hypothetical protein
VACQLAARQGEEARIRKIAVPRRPEDIFRGLSPFLKCPDFTSLVRRQSDAL